MVKPSNCGSGVISRGKAAVEVAAAERAGLVEAFGHGYTGV